jgi:ethanolamine utilization microcompartment shell protein EutS
MQVSQGVLTGGGTVGAVSVSLGAVLSFNGNINGGLTCAGFATNAGSIVGPLTLQTGGVFENNGNTLGTLTLQSGTLLTNSATMNGIGSPGIPTNCMVINAGTMEGVRIDINVGGTLKGTGIFEMSNRVQANAGGTLIPGSSIGIMTVAGTIGRLDLFPGSTTIIEVDLAHPDVNDVIFNTSLNFGGNNAFAGGTLLITNVGSTPFTGSETFTIFKPNFGGDVLHNNFSLPIVVPPPGTGLTWDVTRVRTNGILSMIGLPTYGLSNTATNLTFSWPYTYLGWRLEVQTNAQGIGISTQWFTVPGSGSTNLIRQPINKTNLPTFYRMAYP